MAYRLHGFATARRSTAARSITNSHVLHVDLNPIRGHEQAGARYVLVVTTRAFNDLGTPVVCPITQGGAFARHRGFTVKLADTGMRVTGFVLCNQLRTLDLQARAARFVERAPPDVVDEVLARIAPLFD